MDRRQLIDNLILAVEMVLADPTVPMTEDARFCNERRLAGMKAAGDNLVEVTRLVSGVQWSIEHQNDEF